MTSSDRLQAENAAKPSKGWTPDKRFIDYAYEQPQAPTATTPAEPEAAPGAATDARDAFEALGKLVTASPPQRPSERT